MEGKEKLKSRAIYVFLINYLLDVETKSWYMPMWQVSSCVYFCIFTVYIFVA